MSVVLGAAADTASDISNLGRPIRSKQSPQLSDDGDSAMFYERVDRVIWDALEAELVVSADEVVWTDTRVSVHFFVKKNLPNMSLSSKDSMVSLPSWLPH